MIWLKVLPCLPIVTIFIISTITNKTKQTKQQRVNNNTQINKSKPTLYNVDEPELHKLQETARPSDAKLFYADMDRQIETSTAATLEGFVAMYTKSIHNSVK